MANLLSPKHLDRKGHQTHSGSEGGKSGCLVTCLLWFRPFPEIEERTCPAIQLAHSIPMMAPYHYGFRHHSEKELRPSAPISEIMSPREHIFKTALLLIHIKFLLFSALT